VAALWAAVAVVCVFAPWLLAVGAGLLGLAGWVALTWRRPAAAVVVMVLVVVASAHAFALLYAIGLPAPVVRGFIAAKDVLSVTMAATVLVQRRHSPRAASVAAMVLPFVVYLLGRTALTLGHVPLTDMLLGLRGMLVPVCAFASAVLLAPEVGPRLERAIVVIVAAAAVYAVVELLLPTSYLTHVIRIGPYWTDVKQQGSFLRGGLPGNITVSTGQRRLTGSFGDPLTAGYVIASAVALVLARRVAVTWRVVALVAALALTLTRAGWAIALVAMAVTFVPDLLRGRHAMAVVLAACLVVAVAIVGPGSFIAASLGGHDASIVAHRQFAAQNLHRTFDVFGEGVGSTGAAIAARHTVAGAEVTESVYATIVGQIGLIGLVLFAWFVAGAFRLLARASGGGRRYRAYLGLLIGLLLTGLISEQLLAFNSGWLPVFIVGLGAAGRRAA
jgi:hypothetical protein